MDRCQQGKVNPFGHPSGHLFTCQLGHTLWAGRADENADGYGDGQHRLPAAMPATGRGSGGSAHSQLPDLGFQDFTGKHAGVVVTISNTQRHPRV